MPITKRQFDLGIDNVVQEWMERVYDHLRAHRDQAFSLDDLAGFFQPKADPSDPFSPRARMGGAVEVLHSLGAIERRVVRSQNYYAFFHEFDKDSWRPLRTTITK